LVKVCYKSSATWHQQIGPVIIHITYKSPVISQSQYTIHSITHHHKHLSFSLPQILRSKVQHYDELDEYSPRTPKNHRNQFFRPPLTTSTNSNNHQICQSQLIPPSKSITNSITDSQILTNLHKTAKKPIPEFHHSLANGLKTRTNSKKKEQNRKFRRTKRERDEFNQNQIGVLKKEGAGS
jgi:hypothetical protein